MGVFFRLTPYLCWRGTSKIVASDNTAIARCVGLSKLKSILHLLVPDFDALLNIYEACHHDINSIAAPLMGGQDYAENTHYSVFNLKYLSRLLTEVGFRSVAKWDPEQVDYHDFEDRASKTLESGGEKYRVSLNVEAIQVA